MSNDILDVIDEIDGEVETIESSDELLVNETGEILELDDLDEMTEREAQEITDSIRATATATFVLLARAHEGKAFKALGYETWESYVRTEFDFSTQRSYQLLDLARVTAAIEQATPEGTEVHLTEAQARDIKRELPKITEQIAEQTSDKTGAESGDIVDSIVDEARQQKKADQAVFDEEEKKKAQDEEDAKNAALEDEADKLLEADGPDGITDSADSNYIEIDVDGDDDGYSAREKMAQFGFFNMIENFDTLLEADEMVKLVPDERRDEVLKSLRELISWASSLESLIEES